MKIISLLKTSFLVLENIQHGCLGEYSSKSEGYINIKKEIKNLDISSTKDDRENLQRDRNKAANDLNAALEKYLCNG